MPTNEELARAKLDNEEFARLASEDKRFIITAAYQTVGRFITESDDEWSVALSAYYEAVQGYDDSKGKFTSFAALVIKRRLLDYIQSEQREMSVPVSPDVFTGEKDVDELSSTEKSVYQAETAISLQTSEQSDLREEIDALDADLSRYPISFFELAECSPKAEKTKKACAKVINVILRDEEMFKEIQNTGKLPAKELIRKTWISKKILEHHRKYIIAAAEILHGDYPQIAEYLRFIKEET